MIHVFGVFFCIVVLFLVFVLGMVVGARFEREYWVSHATCSGSVYYKGYFYKVIPEPEDDDDDS